MTLTSRVGLVATLALCAALFDVAAPAVAMPNRRAVSIVYCGLSGMNCSKTFGSGPTHYKRAPSGHDHALGCHWYGHRSTGLGVVKDYCVPAADTAFAPQDQEAERPTYRPVMLGLAGDGTAYVRSVNWSSWRSSSARGTGSYGEDDCSPDCATGTYYYARTVIMLSRPRMKCGFRVFTRGAFRFPNGPPPNVPASSSITWTLDRFPCRG